MKFAASFIYSRFLLDLFLPPDAWRSIPTEYDIMTRIVSRPNQSAQNDGSRSRSSIAPFALYLELHHSQLHPIAAHFLWPISQIPARARIDFARRTCPFARIIETGTAHLIHSRARTALRRVKVKRKLRFLLVSAAVQTDAMINRRIDSMVLTLHLGNNYTRY